jgi:hypothetical protein
MHDLDMAWHGIPSTLTPSQRESLRPHTMSYPIAAHPTDSWETPKLWITTFQRVFKAAGLNGTCGRELPRLFSEAGLKDVQITRYMYPLNDWAEHSDAERRVAEHHKLTIGTEMPQST